MPVSIAVIGPGAIGGTIAAWLAQDEAHDVSLCARTPFDRLKVETPSGPITATPAILTDPAAATPVDWILIATKTYEAEGTALWFPGLIKAGTRVAVLQNGVEHIARFAHWIAPDSIVPVMVDIPAERTAPGHILQRGDGLLVVPDGDGGRAFASLFAHTPITVSLTDDFTTAIWKKLCINCAGAVSALTLKPGGVAANQGAADVMRTLVAECVAVARAERATMPDTMPQDVIAHYLRAAPDSINSMHADRLAGRPLELDARNGVIVRLGEKHGIPTPANAMMVALIEAAIG
ncbi:2-dehydropantoate 2-reductase [Sphingobium boeckii]|uniref:2-dehydropantoate 2-reductase n=1 Tax=Sphingobium boeckii TaxID=1082345 RepID=A0A7W9ED97_9SPHN|nr:2-dehydropantoate 2-reductase [Sphingobium boeckii]MBB5684724.1 2-dehydropantoate 2-reductase [Sphingobium boeckii]